jgi:hypothetical protein
LQRVCEPFRHQLCVGRHERLRPALLRSHSFAQQLQDRLLRSRMRGSSAQKVAGRPVLRTRGRTAS